jgi:hypothetical protein
MEEQWLPVVEWEGYYEVSSMGNVRNVRRRSGTKVGLVLVGRILKDGYKYVWLVDAKTRRKQVVAIHRLVCRAFYGPPPPDHKEVNHIDGVRTNNILENLEWITVSGNRKHGWILHPNRSYSDERRHKISEAALKRFKEHPEKKMCGEKNPRSILTNQQVLEIKKRLAQGAIGRRLAKEFGVSPQYISSINRNHKWKTITLDPSLSSTNSREATEGLP